ncbi:hypothetical protein Sru01_03570 [Sphaerisporangium rufum]|uniref:ComF family protein n=1 Tax=Sphaerisporangium rufum TaxID=1381558 RepID=A0A919V2K3_9ACTN|nr:ComF family protein [Sphaerisporangium rufum]GII75375.1 hypothetical protein Sru01_03570 [Sphaerisporangium rufum]
MLTALLDLVLPARCAGCDRPGAQICAGCLAGMRGDPAPRPPAPAPAGLPPCWSAARYEGTARRVILAYKERGRTALGPPLAACLAGTVLAALGAGGGPARPADPPVPVGPVGPVGPAVALVPVPSARRAVRRRGHDPVGRLAALAGRRLRAAGYPVAPAPVLVPRRRVADQAGLSAVQRAANLTGAFTVHPARGGAPPGAWGPGAGLLVLVDDIVTTGATLAEAARALRAAGAGVALAVTLAGTPRRHR